MSEIPKDNNIDVLLNLIIIDAFFEREREKWDELRNKENELLKLAQQEYTVYFNELFKNGIPTYSLCSGTPLFRARHIRSSDISKMGVNISDLIDSLYKTLLTDEDIENWQKMNSCGSLKFTWQHIVMLKACGIDCFPEEQQQMINKFLKENSVQKNYGFSENESRVPPPLFRKSGRLNTISDAYLYLAFNRDTAIHEMRPSIGQQYSLAEFHMNKDIIIADLSGESIEIEKDNMSLLTVVDKISEPNTDNDDVFYHVTQHMAHMLQERGYGGILYKSALKKGEKNILLFDETDVDFISSEIVAINDVNIDYEIVFPLSCDQDE